MKLTKRELEKLFPNLSREIREKSGSIAIEAVRTEESELKHDFFRSYDPDVVDFLRRCDTEEQGLEIIDFMEKRGEISREYASRLRRQLREKGIRSFGPKKEANYYSNKLEGL